MASEVDKFTVISAIEALILVLKTAPPLACTNETVYVSISH